jgi:predicted component of type VI protein secretion system
MQSSAFGPFRIALVGDFSARTSRGIVDAGRALAQRKAIRVDRDSLDWRRSCGCAPSTPR